MKNLRDRWVLITGAASGIGRALAVEFAKKGSHIIIADIDVAGMDETARMVRERGCNAITVETDVTSPEDLDALYKNAVEKTGRIDVLVNNAGIAMICEADRMEWEEWERILKINLIGPIMLTCKFIAHMKSNGGGHIVNVASMAGIIGIPGMAPYTVTKFGVVGLSESLRAELHAHNIGVTAVCPGVVRTPIIDKSVIKGFDEEIRNAPNAITTSPERAAREIVAGVLRNKAKVVPTPSTKAVHFLKRIFPGLVEFFVVRVYSGWKRAPV